MKFTWNQKPKREDSLYKTIYIRESLAKQVRELATMNGVSFNHVVISMIEHCLREWAP